MNTSVMTTIPHLSRTHEERHILTIKKRPIVEFPCSHLILTQPPLKRTGNQKHHNHQPEVLPTPLMVSEQEKRSAFLANLKIKNSVSKSMALCLTQLFSASITYCINQSSCISSLFLATVELHDPF